MFDLKKSFITLPVVLRFGATFPLKLRRKKLIKIQLKMFLFLQLFVFPSLNSQRISSPQAELIAGELHGFTSFRLLENSIALHVGPVFVSLVGLKTVALSFLHFNSLLGVLGAGHSWRENISIKAQHIDH